MDQSGREQRALAQTQNLENRPKTSIGSRGNLDEENLQVQGKQRSDGLPVPKSLDQRNQTQMQSFLYGPTLQKA